MSLNEQKSGVNLIESKDTYYMQEAEQAKYKTTCSKKQVGCALVVQPSNRMRMHDTVEIVMKGYNGPPHLLSACNPCPRQECKSGTDLDRCRAVHAERRALLMATKIRISTIGATLYVDGGIPCKDCLLELCEAGVLELVCKEETYYDDLSQDILREWISKGLMFRIFTQPGGD